MIDHTHNGKASNASTSGLVRDVSDFAYDAFALAELQTELLAEDCREYSQRARSSGMLLLAGISCGIACLPLILAALALTFSEFFEISNASGCLLAVALGLIMSVLLCSVGKRRLVKHMNIFQRSRREFETNRHWMKRVLDRRRAHRSGNRTS